MQFKINNPLFGSIEVFNTREEAETKLQQIKVDFLAQEEYRFTIAKEVVNGNDTTWLNADLVNDDENGVYFVFNTLTGQHEKIETLSASIARLSEIKVDFLNSCGLKEVELQEDNVFVEVSGVINV